MKPGEQAPIIGSSFVGGMAQSWLIRKYPKWSWLLSAAMIGGGVYLATRPGWQGKVGLGIATSGASGLGTAIIPVPAAKVAGATPSTPLGGLAQRQLAAAQAQREALGLEAQKVGRYPAPARAPQFEEVRLG